MILVTKKTTPAADTTIVKKLDAKSREALLRGAQTSRAQGERVRTAAVEAADRFETTGAQAVGALAKAGRVLVDVAAEDAALARAAFERSAQATSVSEFARAQIDYISTRNEVVLSRARKLAAFAEAQAAKSLDAWRAGMTTSTAWLQRGEA